LRHVKAARQDSRANESAAINDRHRHPLLARIHNAADAERLQPGCFLASLQTTDGCLWRDQAGNAANNQAGTSKSDFIYALESDDAVDGRAGDDVIDGGPGSNFLVGGAGVDNFFLDGRAPTATTWSTIMDFQAGEHVTIWGNRPGVSKFLWVASDGTAGYKGATLHCDLDGSGVIDTSVTFAGLTQAQLPTPSYGVVQGIDYIFI
jgi:hypothetical protein